MTTVACAKPAMIRLRFKKFDFSKDELLQNSERRAPFLQIGYT
jgi:hypothetical protein